MLIKRGHYTVLEHAYATFRISRVTHAFTHQLVRHRLCSFIQQSQRYVNESNFTYIKPPSIKNKSEAHKIFNEFMEYARKTYRKLIEIDIPKEDDRYIPNVTESQSVVTANLREWRHIIEIRRSPYTQM